MKLYLAIALCILGQWAPIASALPQGDVKVTDVLPVGVTIQKIVGSGVNALQIVVCNNLHSQLTLDRASLEAPGFSMTKKMDSSDGTIHDLNCGGRSGVFGGPDAEAISHDIKRAVIILPGGEYKIQLDPAKLFTGLPPEMRGGIVRIRLDFRNLIVAVGSSPSPPSLYGAVFYSNFVELAL